MNRRFVAENRSRAHIDGRGDDEPVATQRRATRDGGRTRCSASLPSACSASSAGRGAPPPLSPWRPSRVGFRDDSPTPPVAGASTPSPRSSPQPFRAADDGGEQRRAKTPRTEMRKTVGARRDRLRGRIRAWRRARARVDSPRLATDPRHRDPPARPRPLLPSVPPPGKKTTRRFVPRDTLARRRAPFPARPRWIRDVARLSSRRRAPRSRADPDAPARIPPPAFPSATGDVAVSAEVQDARLRDEEPRPLRPRPRGTRAIPHARLPTAPLVRVPRADARATPRRLVARVVPPVAFPR